MNNPIKILRSRYPSEIDKPDYMIRMHDDFHSILHAYQDLLSDVNASSIEITCSNVILTTKSNGLRFVVPPLDRRVAPVAILNFADYEPCETKLLNSIVPKDCVVYDIGANIGWHSLNLASSFESLKIFAFEPVPRTYSYLCQNIKLNGFDNVHPVNMGFSSSDSEAEIFFYPEGSGNASLRNLSKREDINAIRVELQTIDNFSNAHNHEVGFIKCDVEGAELLVLQGGSTVLGRDKPIVFAEVLRKWCSQFDYSPNEIFKLMRDHGYKSFTILPENRIKAFEYMDDLTIETNFLFLHVDNHRQLIAELLY